MSAARRWCWQLQFVTEAARASGTWLWPVSIARTDGTSEDGYHQQGLVVVLSRAS